MTDFSSYPRYQKFLNKTILAVDYGRVAIGLALFCPGVHPFPLTHGRIVVKNQENVLSELKKIIQDDSVDYIVIGLPRHADGKDSAMTVEVEHFAQKIKHAMKIPIYFQDETYSTEEAKRRMENSPQFNFKVDVKKIDAVAAQIILEDFIRNSDLSLNQV